MGSLRKFRLQVSDDGTEPVNLLVARLELFVAPSHQLPFFPFEPLVAEPEICLRTFKKEAKLVGPRSKRLVARLQSLDVL